jgi:hypothetical protein
VMDGGGVMSGVMDLIAGRARALLRRLLIH